MKKKMWLARLVPRLLIVVILASFMFLAVMPVLPIFPAQSVYAGAPEATAISESGEIAVDTGDGTLLYNGYIYITGRGEPGTVAKVSTDYSSITVVPILRGAVNSGSIDAIVEAGGYLWVGDYYPGGYLYKLDPTDLSVLGYWHTIPTSYGIYSLCTDGVYIYCGGNTGHRSKFKISDNSTTANDTRDYEGTLHALCEDGNYLYGVTRFGSGGKVLKILKSDLSLTSANVTRLFCDDITQDTNYFYLAAEGNSPYTVVRFAKSDLSSTDLAPTVATGLDGEAKIGDILLSTITAATGSTYYLRMVDMPSFIETNRVSLLGLTGSTLLVNDIIIDGDYIHILRWDGVSNKVYLGKFNKADIIFTATSPDIGRTIMKGILSAVIAAGVLILVLRRPGNPIAWIVGAVFAGLAITFLNTIL